ncbi:hypothetical protein D8B34_23390 [Verminephrobacter eiseniae]|nr:hypothetical protein [Verminephrobacter eiseniae]MCW5295773.1 hypothetical protein [Verminephrobacter eiseniae]MCW8187243.1 hypothetical protein [Verminephrobacter eiseniae]MCW8236549.1 hypothetical protein [Verminephrobacter eiseniae]
MMRRKKRSSMFSHEVEAGLMCLCKRGCLVSRHRSDVVGCAQPSERSARRIAQPIPSVLASDATPRCASMASADRQMIGDATLGPFDRQGTAGINGCSTARGRGQPDDGK